MKWRFWSGTNILSVILTGIIIGTIIIVLFIFIRFISLYLFNEKISLDDIFHSKEITPNELILNADPDKIPKEPSKVDIAVVDSLQKAGKNIISGAQKAVNTVADFSQKVDDNREQVDYYIIVGSFKNLTQARQRAEKVEKDFDADVILLPPTKEGNYRISFGKYSSLEEAKNAIINVRKNLNSEAWVLTVKK